MLFNFYTPYVMSAPGFKPEIVLGVHENKTHVTDDDEHEVVFFLLTHGRQRIHYLDGQVEGQEDGNVFVETPDDAFQFEPLTLDKWQEIGQQGWVVGFDKLKGKFESDHDIQQFYLHEFLDDNYLKWVELQGFEAKP
jgi:hypothetical protein